MRSFITSILLLFTLNLWAADPPTPYIYTLENVNRLVDCDTIGITFNLGFRIQANYRVRLSGINGPENNDREGAANDAVVQVVKDWIADAQKPKEEGDPPRTIYVQYIKPDPFDGRFIGDLLDDKGESLTQHLRDGWWVKDWDGKGRKPTYNDSDVRVIVEQFKRYQERRK